MGFMAVVLLFKKGFVHKRLVGTLLGGVVVTALIVMASTPVVQRITTLAQGEIDDSLTGRLTYWAGTKAMIADNLAAGTGPGTFQEAFPPYQVSGWQCCLNTPTTIICSSPPKPVSWRSR